MLAGLLRRVLAFLLLIGVGAALGLQFALNLPAWLAWPLGLLLVPLLPALSTLRTFRLARRQQGDGVADEGDAVWRQALRGDLLAVWRLFLWRQAFAATLPATGRADAVDVSAPAPRPLPEADPSGAAESEAASPPVPVLLIHGFVCNHRVWDEIARHLAGLGHPVWRVDLEPLFCEIDAYAPRIEAAVAEMLRGRAKSSGTGLGDAGAVDSTERAPFAIVAHSMGGLAARAWLRAHPERLAALQVLVTLGSPHRGTLVNPDARARNARAMIHRSDWLRRLEADERPALRDKMVALLSGQDQIVFPQREQWLPGMRVERFTGVGHLGLLSDPAVMRRVGESLRRWSSERARAPG